MQRAQRVSNVCKARDDIFVTTDDAEIFKIKARFKVAQEKLRKYANEKRIKKRLEKAVLRKFIKQDQVPSWYREMSEAQMVAADSLHASIRDDLEQGTVHRCCQNLLALGLKPLVDRAKVSQALKLCRNSDLVFLWILMESFYEKTCSNCMHLVQNYTVNEQIILSAICHLDTVATLRRLNNLIPAPTPKCKVNPPEHTKRLNLKCDSPYISRLKKPIHHKKKLYAVPRPPKINLSPYDKYLDDTHKIPNEARWFELGMNNEVLNVTAYKSTGSALNIVSDLINNQLLQDSQINSDHFELPPSICLKHKTEEDIRHAMNSVNNDSSKYEKSSYINLNRREKGLMRKVFSQMNQDESGAKEQLTKLAQKQQLRTWLNLFIQGLARNISDLRQFQLSDKTTGFSDETSVLKTDHKNCDSCNDFKRETFGPTSQHLAPFNNAYFRSGTRKLPSSFHYDKIFGIDLMLKSNMIEKALHRILSLYRDETTTDLIDSFILKCWTDARQVQPNKIEVNHELKTPANSTNKICGDTDFLSKRKNKTNNLLKDALSKTNDHHYALATIPDAHKLPILREWLRARFNHLYTKSECQRALKKSILHFERLLKTKLKVKTPKSLDILPTKYVSYEHHDSIYKKSQEIIQRYIHEVRLALLRDSNLYWRVLKPYYCTNGPPRDVFYAYMPACEYDTIIFRPWKKNEFVDAKFEFEKRQIARRKQNANQR